MTIYLAVCNSFKQEILLAVHNFSSAGGNTFKLSLYTSVASLSSTTTVYTSTNEVSASGQYTAGGGVLAGQQTSLDTGVGIVTFSNLSFTGVTLTAAGALIYNTSQSNKAVCALDFGGDKTATAGTFTIVFPAFTSSNAILRIA